MSAPRGPAGLTELWVPQEHSWVAEYAMLAPGSVLQPFSYIPPGQVWAGNPARYVRDVEEDEKEFIRETAQENHDLGNAHADEYALDYPMVRTPASPITLYENEMMTPPRCVIWLGV